MKSTKTKPPAKRTKKSSAEAPKETAKKKSPGRRSAKPMPKAKFAIGDVVRHRYYPFRGIIFDVDPVFNSTEEWWQSIPEDIRPRKNQPYYHLLAENDKTEYIAYVSEQNLLPDDSGQPLRHPQVPELFMEVDGRYRATFVREH